MQDNLTSPKSGIMGSRPPKSGQGVPKQAFSNIFEEDAKMKAQTANNVQEALKKSQPKEDEVAKLNNAMSGKGDEAEKVEKEIGELEKFTEEDLELAEQLLFNGYCEKTFKLTPKSSITVASISAAEIDIINEMMFEFGKNYETEDGRLDVSQKTIDFINSLYLLAVAFKGFNGKELSETSTRSLSILKNAFKNLSELEIQGDLKKYKEYREEVKKAIKNRSIEIKRLSTPVVDAISQKRYLFERTLFQIVNKGDVIPKF